MHAILGLGNHGIHGRHGKKMGWGGIALLIPFFNESGDAEGDAVGGVAVAVGVF